MEHTDIFKRYNKFLKRVNYSESSILSHCESVKRFSIWLDVPLEEVTPTVLYQYLGYLHHSASNRQQSIPTCTALSDSTIIYIMKKI